MTGSGNHTYLIPGDAPVLVDAGVGHPDHLQAVDEGVRGSAAPLRVVVTHAHVDHASGAPAIAGRRPDASFAKLPWPDHDTRYPVAWEALAGGDVVPTDEGSLVAVHTPGHAPDHLCFWHADSRTLFCGDLAVIGSTVVIPAGAGGDLAAYLDSLRRVLALDPARMLPAHGPIIEDPAALLTHYLAHRAERERQVLELLAAGVGDVDAIAARIYKGLARALVPMARQSVTAHLVKLEKERRASVDPAAGRWAIADNRSTDRPAGA